MKTIKEAFKDQIEYINRRRSGSIQSLITPWPGLNKAGIDGLEWGNITTVAAMSGTGKTTFINQLISEFPALNPKQNVSVLFFTVDMGIGKVVARTISHMTRRTVNDIYTNPLPNDIENITKDFTDMYSSRDINYIEKLRSPSQTAKQMDEFLQTRKNNFNLIIYDHVSMVKKTGDSERGSIMELMEEINELKKRHTNSQYIVISQLNRNIEDPQRIRNSKSHYPLKSDLYGSDAPYNYSDIFMVLHNPRKNLGITSYGPRKYPTLGFMFGHILKCREGDPGKLLVFKNLLSENRMEELTDKELIKYGFKS